MDDTEIQRIAELLEAISDENAESQLTTGQPFLWLTANRAGCIQVAVRALRAASTPIPTNDCRAEPVFLEHNQISESKEDYVIGAIQRIDKFPENKDLIDLRKRKALRNDGVALVGCGLVGFVLLFLVIAGIKSLFGSP